MKNRNKSVGRLVASLVLSVVCATSGVSAQVGPQPPGPVGLDGALALEQGVFGWALKECAADLFLSAPLGDDGRGLGVNVLGERFGIDAPLVALLVAPELQPGETVSLWVGSISGPSGDRAGAGFIYHSAVVDRVVPLACFTDQAYGNGLIDFLRGLRYHTNCRFQDALSDLCEQQADSAANECFRRIDNRIKYGVFPGAVGALVSCTACMLLPSPFTCGPCITLLGVAFGTFFQAWERINNTFAALNRAHECCCLNAEARSNGTPPPPPGDAACALKCPW